jgi:hypothetical protein
LRRDRSARSFTKSQAAAESRAYLENQVLYLTSTRLMRESEDAVREHAGSGDEIPQRVCAQLLAKPPRYSEWHALHERKMHSVADARLREPQVLQLRGIAMEQVHRTAIVNYLRLGRVTGAARDQTLALFHGISDLRDATLAEHRNYLLAASTQVCAFQLLDLVGDREGLRLVRRYDLAYAQYFAMFCDRARTLQKGKRYLLESLLPEVRGVADGLRRRIVGAPLPTGARRSAADVGHIETPARMPARGSKPRDRSRAGPRSEFLPATPLPRSRTAR